MNAFNRIAGYKEEKEELIKLCNLIKNREELVKVGGKLPRGVFLLGPNGVGKTIMAKCFIKESNCNVVNVSYNDINTDDDFIPYIKNKFKEAAKKTPCILFIDELDKLIGNGSNFFSDDNFEKSKIILNEINRYESKDGLFLLVTGNENYIIDESVIRSGRIDRVIRVSLPNEDERLAIIKYYARNKKCDKSLDLNRVAKLTHGFSGADIEALLNNSIIKAFGENRDYITYEDITTEFYKKIFSTSEREVSLDEEGIKMLAYHEAGHAVISALYNMDNLDFITILPRGETRGFVFVRSDERRLATFETKEHEIQVCLAGMASEELFMQKRCLGSGEDIKKARSITSFLVRNCAYSGFETTLLGSSSPFMGEPQESISNERKLAMEKEEDRVINKMYDLVKKLLLDNSDLVDLVVAELIEKKTINRERINDIMNKRKGPKGPACNGLPLEREELADF